MSIPKPNGQDRPGGERPDYLSAKEAAELLGVNRATVINWARQGRFGGYQFGQRGIYRFDRQEILDYINRSRLPTGQHANHHQNHSADH